MIDGLLPSVIDRSLRSFLEEDLPEGDMTSRLFFDDKEKNRTIDAAVISEERGILAGSIFVPRIFAILDEPVKIDWSCREGEFFESGATVCLFQGPIFALLSGERLALNLLKHLSAIATLTRTYVDIVSGRRPPGMRPLRITETRKTLPGLRMFQKYAVRTGGGWSHRSSLSSGILIKDNHIVGVGSVTKAIQLARKKAPHPYRIEIEVDTSDQALEAANGKADILLLDNMSIETMANLVPKLRTLHPDIILEVSGGLTVDKVQAVSVLDVDLCSVGALTHSPGDLSLRVDFRG